ncbi:MAG TPA: DUF1223 domain-containing protein [bacterium]|nr:DUF1223 domain-containing protein [bacterium]
MNPFPWLVGLSFLSLVQPAGAQMAFGTRAGEPAPVVLELFTSQGCSSCPAAETLLNRMGVPLIPLAFHVDYWNYLGWTDPFSSADYTGRQRAYAATLGRDSLYTPQLIIAGLSDAVGSDESAVQAGIAATRGRLAQTSLTLAVKHLAEGLQIQVKSGGADKPGGDWVLNVAVFENGLVTAVPRGENSGKTLKENFVVRSFSRLYPMKEVQILWVPWNGAWKNENLGVAAYLQDRRSLAVDSAAQVFPVPSP